MRLLTMKTGENCLVVSLAMVLGRSPENILAMLDVNPNEVIFKDGGKRGIHVQEVIDLVMPLGITVIENHFGFTNPNTGEVVEVSRAPARFLNKLRARVGVVNGVTHSGGMHSCAWDGSRVYDPKGVITDLESVFAKVYDFWIL